jgi:DNA-binding GntR family transcriptional regulator
MTNPADSASPERRAADSRPQAPRTYKILRDRIILGDLTPLTKLKISDIAAEFDVSPGAVREALSQLATSKLVEARDQQGFRVAPISLADLDDLTEPRVQIEGLALGQAIARGDLAWEAEVRRAQRAMEAHPPRPNDLEGAVRHDQFHQALVAGCGSPNLLRIRAGLYDLSERYRFLAMRLTTARPRPVTDEHAAIAAAALSRQADVALAAMANHIRFTAQLVRNELSSLGVLAVAAPGAGLS